MKRRLALIAWRAELTLIALLTLIWTAETVRFVAVTIWRWVAD